MDSGAWWATVQGVARVAHDLVTKPPLTCLIPPAIQFWHYLPRHNPDPIGSGESLLQSYTHFRCQLHVPGAPGSLQLADWLATILWVSTTPSCGIIYSEDS